ncbi:DNA mismatch repair protein MutS [Fonticella tunisiensis]|uniref:DNA mismatch repair protein MutS n=1 Tax=Fonticella tunisiensis TaxID=1096341 RepID=A0A4R7KRU1_9CLOT|nr:DNA mismatch repair protein MutS [Fonticella tunisiensis]TDT61527.1 DNA mismatch repair protein MutS [Fonticella tunisiensis]
MALTPMMQQYLEIKEQCKDCILFFRLGDFYEMFFEDAEIASRELELVLTGRDCGLDKRAPMCGVPYHSSESYISKLIEKGYKVAICEQVEDPALAKGIVKREIIRIVTPGTVMESSLLDEKKNNYIGCLYFSRDGFSLSVCDISTGEFLTTSSKGSLSRAVDELSKYNPAELLIIDNNIQNREKLEKTIKERFNLLLSFVKHDSPENNIILERFNDDLSSLNEDELNCCGCLYKYIYETQKNSLGHIVHIKKYELNDFMVLDASTRKNLELTQTIFGKQRKGSLLWALDKTQTSMGSRLLRKWIEEPLISQDEINKRLDSVEELMNNVYLSSDLKEYLKNVYDIERLISKISCGSANARDLISLKESLRFLPDIKAAISVCKTKLLSNIYENFDTLDDVYKLIDCSIADNPPLQLKEGGIIKEGYEPEIDKLREAMINGREWIANLEQKEREETGIKSLKVGYNKVFGYYIEITKSNLSSIPEGRYIRKQTLANAERFITPELKEIENLVLGAEEKVVELEYEKFVSIRAEVSKEVTRIQKMARYIAIIDVLLSFSQVSFENNYVKPKISSDGEIDIKDGRHPVVEKVIQGIFVPNDTFLNLKDDVISIITGPNMAGKSTYMRQVALITLMAQIGCFVPARSAKISIVDRIFTRIGASDDLSSGKSTFMVEMSEVSNILQNATRNSLIILDEVGRGTSTFDGLSIAWSVVEYIGRRIGAKTLFATHYHELTELEGKIKGVKNYCISVKEHGDDILFLRKIIRGGADQSYGIQVAKLAGLPDEVVSKAKEILSKLEESDINKNIKENIKKDEIAATAIDETKSRKDEQISMFNYKENEIIVELKEIDIVNITPMEAMNILYTLSQKAKKM